MKHLISLEDHNRAITEGVADPFLGEARPNGISCKCGHELLDENPNRVLKKFPLCKSVRCPKCGWKGERLV